MASTVNTGHSSIKAPCVSSLYLSNSKVSRSYVSLKTRSFSSNATRLAFSPLPEGKKSLSGVSFSGDPLRFFGWGQQIRRRSIVDLTVVSAAAADADDGEIDISDRLVLLLLNYYYLYSTSRIVSRIIFLLAFRKQF